MGRLELLGHFQVPSQSTSSLFNVLLAHFLPIYFHLPAAGSSGEKTAQGDRDVAELCLTRVLQTGIPPHSQLLRGKRSFAALGVPGSSQLC